MSGYAWKRKLRDWHLRKRSLLIALKRLSPNSSSVKLLVRGPYLNDQ
jgi:hypothetical protein